MNSLFLWLAIRIFAIVGVAMTLIDAIAWMFMKAATSLSEKEE